MEPVYLTAKETAAAVGLSYYTVIRHAKEKFPNAKMLHDSRKKGYRFPDSDVLAYALAQGQDVYRQAQRKVDEVRAKRDARPAAS